MVRMLVVAGVVILLLGRADAKSQEGGAVAGRVVDETGGALPGVSVDLKASGSETFIETVTDDTGNYSFESLPAGPAEIYIRLINFSTVRRDIVITAGETLTTRCRAHRGIERRHHRYRPAHLPESGGH